MNILMIVFTLVAVGIVWVVIQNIISESAEDITLEGLSLNVEVQSAKVENGNMTVNVKRNVGKGNLTGILFVFFDGKNSESKQIEISLKELEGMTFTFDLDELNVSEIKTVSVAPIFLSGSGKEVIAGPTHIGKLKLESSNNGTCVASSNPCELSFECGTATDSCGVEVSCGTCSSGFSCLVNHTCVPTTNETIPIADFIGSPTSGVNSSGQLTVQFTDLSNNTPTSWFWYFGDGLSSSAQNVFHTYAVPGNYTVTLTATNSAGSHNHTKINYITYLFYLSLNLIDGIPGRFIFCLKPHLERPLVREGIEIAVHAVDKSPVIPYLRCQPGDKSAAAQDVIHDIGGIKIRIIPFHAQVPELDAGL